MAAHAPRHLTASSKALYKRLVADYGLADEPQALQVLVLAMEAVDRGEQARKTLERDGLFFTSASGLVKQHPAVGVERDSAIRAARLLRELSLDGAYEDPRIARPNGKRN